MNSADATFQNGHVILNGQVNWPDGTPLKVEPVTAAADGNGTMTDWPANFLEKIRSDWGDEPFERPSQGETEARESW